MATDACAGDADLSSYDRIQRCADWLLAQCGADRQPEYGIVCGSGLGALSLNLEDTVTFPYETVPYFPIRCAPRCSCCCCCGCRATAEATNAPPHARGAARSLATRGAWCSGGCEGGARWS